MKNTKTWVELDGSAGEGGGQILRTALALSMITQTPFRIDRIRAGRQKPGLLRQHLTAVNAAAAICGATVSGAELGSRQLSFEPGPIQGGDYRFAIGSAGSTTLVLQTVVPALWFAAVPSRVSVSGGTHNSAAPPTDFLQKSWLPLLRRMGVTTDIDLKRHGFYPAGGGEVEARVEPVTTWQPLHLTERGELQALRACAIVAGVPGAVARRELDVVLASWPQAEASVLERPAHEGPGNVVLLEVESGNVVELFIGFGEKGISAESVARRLCHEAQTYINSGACVGEHMADQLLLPLALAGGGSFTASAVSSHLHTNAAVIAKFLPLEVEVVEQGGGWLVTVG